ncbi:MAG: SDR family NAD(P)-dependent oxidoreductase [Acidimicrobiaceae bacterium]|nr:SDR family NAD(P)-dependent oxidoreductase [Acidimicrobiaceae bacterium]MXV88026.1 SDR family NAD(P)-dependent oxidoreductase [Acidimicrobiales bacterium]MXZ14752.1 SDR family NAD(P)-dependent oxidoreductase [Acidimicrobiales bacterium]MYB81367.1 SDR family NAD(P)-dependent oxidoreductase [Acidimicrobiales bacterium]MYG62813.1 SDR family NAD(P)-dependent oxidoreductase [Acidimicrobiales bacterium]
METMTGRVAVVTGAASGIGKALALGFAGEGANVVLADIEEEPLRAAEAEVADHGVEALGVITDVTDADSVGALAQATIDRFGAVHMVCNNAGVGGGGLIRNQQLVDWKWVVDVCLWGVIHGVHHFLPHLIEAEESHIMSTASVAGLMSVPGLGPYNAAKYGVVAIMETLHLEMQRDRNADVGVSVLCPGVVRTNIATAQRNRPEELRRQRRPRPEGEAPSETADARRRNANIAAALERGMDPAEVAAKVIEAMYERRFWVLSHPELLADVNHRNQQLADLENPTIYTSFTDGEQ